MLYCFGPVWEKYNRVSLVRGKYNRVGPGKWLRGAKNLAPQDSNS